MNNSIVRETTPFVLFSFILYAGCGTTQPTQHLDKYDGRPYADIATYPASKDDVHKATALALQQKGFVVTLSDPVTGLMNGELENPAIIPEEQKSNEQYEKASTGDILLGILGIIFIFGIIGWLVGSSEDDSSEHNKREKERHREPYYSPPVEPKTSSYRYVVALTLTAYGTDSTEVAISAVRAQLENGSVVSSGRMENKYLNYSIFEAIQSRLEMKE